jgi:hypothetical protein
MVTRFLRRRAGGWYPRLRTIRELYRSHHGKNGARALRLLRSWLSSAQREQFETKRYFDVIGCDSGRRYRIRWGRNSNVHEIDEAGDAQTGWCFAPIGNLFEGDVMLAQKIALETSESKALALANRFSPKAPLPANRRPSVA